MGNRETKNERVRGGAQSELAECRAREARRRGRGGERARAESYTGLGKPADAILPFGTVRAQRSPIVHCDALSRSAHALPRFRIRFFFNNSLPNISDGRENKKIKTRTGLIKLNKLSDEFVWFFFNVYVDACTFVL